MTTPITKEQELRAFITGFLTDPAHDEHSKNSMTIQVFRIALAAMGAEKVILYRERNPYNGMTTGWQELTDDEYEFIKDNAGENAEFRTVYTAPPAPVVPEIDRKAIADRVYGKCCRIPGATFYNAAEFALDEVDACRAEILKNSASVKPSTDAGCVTNNPSNYASVKDHLIRELVNELRDIAVEYHGTQQLRERIARTVRAAMLNHSENERDMVERVSQPNKLSFDQWMSQQEGSIDVECGCVMTEVLFHWMRVAYEAGNCRENEDSSTKNFRELAKTSTNSPAIPDGWIKCSERMPDTMISVLVTGTWFHHAVSFWDGASWCDLDFEQPVTHWMPLPAAPQQEGK